MDSLTSLPAFLTSLGVGLLVGLERQRRPETLAGLRTFALSSVGGTVCGLLAQQTGSAWLLPAFLLVLAVTMVGGELRRRDADGMPDTTTTIALVLCGLYGAMLWYGHTHLTVALALATTALLYFKTELHDVTRHVSRQDMVSFLQFGAISFVIRPVLPNQGYGPFAALNPYEIWLMVVLVAGVSLVGYLALRLAGPRRAPVLLGVLGGLVSSTATTLVLARSVKHDPRNESAALIVILTANLVLLIRLLVITLLVAPAVLATLAPALLLALMLGATVVLRLHRAGENALAQQILTVGNPLELKTALQFGGLFAIALLVTAWLNSEAGRVGVYAIAPLLGLTDMDAITLSTLKLFRSGQLLANAVLVALFLAIAANLVFKAGIAWVLGSRRLGLRVGFGFGVVLAGLAAATFVI